MPESRTIKLPARYKILYKLYKNIISQIAEKELYAKIGSKRYDKSGKIIGKISYLNDQSTCLLVKKQNPDLNSFDHVLLVSKGNPLDDTWPLPDDLENSRWLRPAVPDITAENVAFWESQCAAVRETWKHKVILKDEVREGNIVIDSGLRPPQTGAIYAALAHWRVSNAPATIVMPTGTGKTETMLALLAHERFKKLLVVVPTQALREQTAKKFSTFGLLHDIGILYKNINFPIVGILLHKLKTAEEVESFFSKCNVVIATMNIVGQCSDYIQKKISELCSHLFIDEAHHVPAPTWDSFRKAFSNKCILQFTATPFRSDGKHLEGKVIFNYPLRKAQEEGYFKKINFRTVDQFDESLADKSIAKQAVKQLKIDLSEGFDHLIMARTRSISRAEDVFSIYRDISKEYDPIIIHSKLGDEEKRNALNALFTRKSRIVICVDMLGEGFDLPQLKIAALHDMHKSLAITLQFTGRFTRSDAKNSKIGDATVIANIADPEVEENLQGLYAENADWNFLLKTLSEGAAGRHIQKNEFLERFIDPPPEVALQNIQPKMSSVVYRTRCKSWSPNEVLKALNPHDIYAGPTVNPEDSVQVIITRSYNTVRWGKIKEIEDITWDMYLIHWDSERNLLFINSSDNSSVHEHIAKSICGDDVKLIHGENIFRVLYDINRMVLINLGLNHTISRSIRFSMHVGSDIGPAISDASAQNKTKSNLFGIGYEQGKKTTIGCSQKGRIWSHLIAYDMSEWVDWCHHIGAKLIDDSISTDEPFRNLIIPESVNRRPELVPIAIEWGSIFFRAHEDEISISIDDKTVSFYETNIELIGHTEKDPIQFKISMEGNSHVAIYEIKFSDNGIDYILVSEKSAIISIRRKKQSLTEWFRSDSPVIFFANGSVLNNQYLFTPPDAKNRLPYPVERIIAWDWSGVDIKVESQTPQRLENSIQRHVIQNLMAPLDSPPWDIIFDDDDAGEAADIVTMRSEGDKIVIHFYHCKYAHGESPGSRLGDLYEVCGQAQRSVRWKNNILELCRHLRLREEARMKRIGITRYELGNNDTLKYLKTLSRKVSSEINVFIVQPGLSKEKVTDRQLDLLSATDLYLKETSCINMSVISSE